MNYFQLTSEEPLPEIKQFRPFKACVIVEDVVGPEWQSVVSKWLIDSGCLYMMAWGRECSSWDDSVDYANLENFGFGEIPDDQLVMTTWHENESLEDFFCFAKKTANHPDVQVNNLLVIHISTECRRDEFAEMLARV